MLTAQKIIDHYGLEPLDQEGGYFRQTWRSHHRLTNAMLGAGYSEKGDGSGSGSGDHPLGTIIYFLLTADAFSAMHRLPTAEHWLFHLGDPIEMLLLHADGASELRTLGPEIDAGQELMLTAPAQSWQGTRLAQPESGPGFSLVSCVMCPGFEWSDFELGEPSALLREFPERRDAILARCRERPVSGKL
jgi:predicted cupin superfamily sugar epimerase